MDPVREFCFRSLEIEFLTSKQDQGEKRETVERKKKKDRQCGEGDVSIDRFWDLTSEFVAAQIAERGDPVSVSQMQTQQENKRRSKTNRVSSLLRLPIVLGIDPVSALDPRLLFGFISKAMSDQRALKTSAKGSTNRVVREVIEAKESGIDPVREFEKTSLLGVAKREGD